MKTILMTNLMALSLLLPRLAAAAETPTASVTNGGFAMARPEMIRDGWVDLDKNGRKDIYEDPARPVEKRVNDLLQRMTREEKIGQLTQRLFERDTDRKEAALIAQGGVGSYLGARSTAEPELGLRNRIQRVAAEDSRLGIPLLFGFDTIHGLRTVFPIPLGLAATWDTNLVERVQAVAAAESAAVGMDWVFAPMVDIARDPRWGRISEGAGEDPWLGSQMAAAAVRGFQGANPAEPGRVLGCLKHYVGYGAAEGGRDYNTTEISVPTLRNVYLPPFKAGLDAGAVTIMSAFNCLNGFPASANRFTLDEVLRQEWKFPGLVLSDWNAVKELVHHGHAKDETQAAQLALSAGVDMEMLSDCYRGHLAELVRQRVLSGRQLDEAVRRVLRVKFEKGLFDHPYAAPVACDEKAFTALAREAVSRSCVLLKNENQALPLNPQIRRVAVIGPLGEDRHAMLSWWSGIGRDEDVVTLAEAVRQQFGTDHVEVVKGCAIQGDEGLDLDPAIAAARDADVVLLALGESADMSGENNNRLTLGLPGRQQELFDRVAAAGKPVISVLFAGRPLAVPQVLKDSAAVLMAWQPGVQAGPGIVDVLTGRTGPSGRLICTVPVSVGQVPIYYNHFNTGRPEANYRDGTSHCLLPFGFGLTYSRFEYGPTRVAAQASDHGGFSVTTTLTNIGDREATEVAQLYLRDLACSVGVRPVRELKGFQRVTLQPGESREITFNLTRADLGSWSPEGKWVVEPGAFEAVVAPNADSGVMVRFTVTLAAKR